MRRTDIIFSLVGAFQNGIVGTTKLQKLIFLVEQEKGLTPTDGPFGYEAYRFGPYSRTVHEDIEFLVNIGYLKKSGEDIEDLGSLSIDDIEQTNADRFLSRRVGEVNDFPEDEESESAAVNTTTDDLVLYRISEKGAAYLQRARQQYAKEMKGIEEIRETYGKRSLREILQHVYSKYPEYTTESEIKEKLK
jgi:uncharacterized protein YwgA